MGMWSASIAFSQDHVFQRLKTFPWGIITCLLGGLAVGMVKAHLRLNEMDRSCLADDLAGMASAALLLLISINPGHPLHRLFGSRPLVFVGTFAYSIYLIHAPLLQVIWQLLPALQVHQGWMLAVLWIVGVPVILGVSYLFYLLCEEPFLRYKITPPRSMVAKTVEEPAP